MVTHTLSTLSIALRNRSRRNILPLFSRLYSSTNGDYNGGSSGGAIRSAGGAFAERERIQEELYIRERQRQQIEALRQILDEKEKAYKSQFPAGNSYDKE